jgi:hypothetical protein
VGRGVRISGVETAVSASIETLSVGNKWLLAKTVSRIFRKKTLLVLHFLWLFSSPSRKRGCVLKVSVLVSVSPRRVCACEKKSLGFFGKPLSFEHYWTSPYYSTVSKILLHVCTRHGTGNNINLWSKLGLLYNNLKLR